MLLVSILKLCFKQELQRSLTAACSLRILMLLPRFGELRKLSEAILRALPAMLVTFAATSIVWVIFAILAVNMYGGMFWQCVALADAAGVPGCGVPLAANSSSEFDTSGIFSRYTDPIGCRYAPAPLAVPHGVVPGATTSAQCGCTFEEQKVTYGGERIEISADSKIFSPANLRVAQDSPQYAKLVDYWMENRYTLRYTGGLVPDICQQFTKQMGVFANPTSDKSPAKLRLAFEAAPFGLLVEKAGGKTSDGVSGGSILDVKITGIDQRTPLCIGSANEVDRFNTLLELK